MKTKTNTNKTVTAIRGEEVKVIPGSKTYYITKSGKVYNKDKRRLKAGPNGRAGYSQVSIIFADGTRVSKTVHRLVWLAWNGPIPDGLVINHKDENKTNNNLDNLELMTRAENLKYGTRTVRGRKSFKTGKSLKNKYEKAKKGVRTVSEKTRELARQRTLAFWAKNNDRKEIA